MAVPGFRWIAISMLIPLLSTCAPGQIERRVLTPIGEPRARACVLTVDTRFKSALVECVAQGLLEDGVAVTVQDVRSPAGCLPQETDAVIIVAHMQGFQADEGSLSYMRHHGDRPNVVYSVTTMSGGDGLPEGKHTSGVDAVTRASNMDAVPDWCNDLLGRARAVLGGSR